MTNKKTETGDPTGPRTFYSTAGALTIHMSAGKQVMHEGQLQRMGERIIEFHSSGAETYGRFVTSDPDEIAFLDRRMLEVGDVFGPEEYGRRTIPAEVRASAAEQLVETQQREIGNLNRILADLQAQGKLPSRPQAQR